MKLPDRLDEGGLESEVKFATLIWFEGLASIVAFTGDRVR